MTKVKQIKVRQFKAKRGSVKINRPPRKRKEGAKPGGMGKKKGPKVPLTAPIDLTNFR